MTTIGRKTITFIQKACQEAKPNSVKECVREVTEKLEAAVEFVCKEKGREGEQKVMISTCQEALLSFPWPNRFALSGYLERMNIKMPQVLEALTTTHRLQSPDGANHNGLTTWIQSTAAAKKPPPATTPTPTITNEKNGPPCTTGMLAFQALPAGGLVDVIKQATGSSISHVGIVHEEKGVCLVREAIGEGVHDTPFNDFLNRSPGRVWFKTIRGLDESKARTFVQATERYLGIPYDYYYRYNNVPVYCSELIVLGAQAAALVVDFTVTDIPAAWLHRESPAVETYLQEMHHISKDEAIPSEWRILTPRDLYYSDLLEQPVWASEYANGEISFHAVFDTLPGKTVDEKFDGLRKRWGFPAQKVEIKEEAKGSTTNYHFSWQLEGQSYSLTLFGAFPEEKALAEKILH